jgi:hypothetical protein
MPGQRVEHALFTRVGALAHPRFSLRKYCHGKASLRGV